MSNFELPNESEGFEKALADMARLKDAKAELDAKERQLREGEQATTGAIIDNTGALERAVAQTRSLSAATQGLTSALSAELAVLRESTALWEARAAAMSSAGARGASAARGGAVVASETAAAAPVRTPRAPRAPRVVPEPVSGPPFTQPEYRMLPAGPRYGYPTPVEPMGPMAVAQAAQRSPVQLPSAAPLSAAETILYPPGYRGEEPSAARPMLPRKPGAINYGGGFYGQAGASEVSSAATAERLAQERSAAPSVPAGENIFYPPGARGEEPSVARPMQPRKPGAIDYGAGFRGEAGAGGGASPTAARMAAESQKQAAQAQTAATKEATAAQAELAKGQEAAGERAARLAGSQKEVNRAYNQSVAAYAESNTVLSRNGALTTEFIQAFARGDVTLKEFSSQMTSTIGKFGGWAIAGALVYGAYEAVKKLGVGAKETQEGIQQLSRFIPAVTSGKPRQEAEGTFRDISQEMNVPIKEVTESMSIMARVFHNTTDAGNAARAVILASRLDQISTPQSELYLTGIAQSFGFAGEKGGGAKLIGVVDSLNALQNQLGPRVNQTLPALARVAPAAIAGGLTHGMLEALVAVGVRSGMQGPQVGTALYRSISNFAFSPASEKIFRGYGIEPKRGDYEGLVNQVIQRTTDLKPGQKPLTGSDMTDLSIAMGGRQWGPRGILPLLMHANQIPEAKYAAEHPTMTATQELQHVLGSVGEQFKKLGIEIENIGSKLESSGLLEPVQLLLRGLGLLGQGIELLLGPVETVAHSFTELPGPLKDILGVLAGVAALRAVEGSKLGRTAENFIGRLPGLGALQNNPRQAIEDTVARYRVSEVPRLARQWESGRMQVLEANQTVTRTTEAAKNQALVAMQPGSSKEQIAAGVQTEEARVAAVKRLTTLEAVQAENEEIYIRSQAIVQALTDKRVTTQEKLAVIYDNQLMVATDQLAAMKTTVKEQAETLVAGGTFTRATGAGAKAAATQGARGSGWVVSPSGLVTPEAAPGGGGVTGSAAGEPIIVPPPSPAAPGLRERLRTSPAAEAVKGGVGSLQARAGEMLWGGLPGLSGGGAALRGALSNPFPLLIGSQLAGSVLGGGVGGAVSTVGGALALGAMASQFGGRGVGSLVGRGLAGVGIMAGEATATGAAATAVGGMMANPLFGAGLALTYMGATTHGAGGLAEGVAGGAMLGGTIGSIFPGPGTAVGAGIGAVAGAGLHFVFGSGGDSDSQAKRQAEKLSKVTMKLNMAMGAKPDIASQATFSDVFGATLDGAFGGDVTSADSQKQQTQVQTTLRQLAAQLASTGLTSGTGAGAAGYLERAIGTAATAPSYSNDPAGIGQIVDSATSALMQPAADRFTYRMATATSTQGVDAAYAGSVANLGRARAGIASGMTDAADEVAADRGNLAQSQLKLATDRASGAKAKVTTTMYGVGGPYQATTTGGAGSAAATDQKLIAAAQAKLTADLARVAHGKDTLSQFDVKSMETLQANAAAALQANLQRVSSTATLASAVAGGNKMTQANVAVAAAKTALHKAETQPGLSDADRTEAVRTAQAQLLTGRTARTQLQASELQSRIALKSSTIPTWEPVTQAKAGLDAATKYYNWVKAHAKDFDPAEINAALAAKNAAANALADQKYQLAMTNAAADASLFQARHAYDPAAVGREQIAQGQGDLGRARTYAERQAARTKIAGGQNAVREAAQQTTQAAYQIAETQAGGDSMQQALIGVAAADAALASALGPQQLQAAQQQMAAAQQAVKQAAQARIIATGELKASETNDQLKQDQIRLTYARQALAEAKAQGSGPDVIRSDQQNVNSLVLQKQNDYVSQRLSTIQFQQSTMQLSAQGALKELEALSKLHKLSVSQKQQIASAMYAIETGQSNTSLFNLAPTGSHIKTPTIYDINTATRRERAQLRGHGSSHGHVSIGGSEVRTTQGALVTHDVAVEHAIKQMHDAVRSISSNATGGATVVNVYVASGGDAGAVADAIDRTLGTRVHARLRSAGLRGV